jgi:hypothetical protein
VEQAVTREAEGVENGDPHPRGEVQEYELERKNDDIR